MSSKARTLKVVGSNTMHCDGCESSVKFALCQLPGIQEVDANHKTQLIRVTFKPEIADLERIRQELDWIGYQVEDA